jgi:hypothetical protein
MTTLHLLHSLEPMLTAAGRLYAVAGELLSISVILWSVNLMAGMVRHTYNAGVIVGSFYRQHCHKTCKWVFVNAIALLILLIQLSFEGAQLVWRNRYDYLETADQWRNQIGKAFIYESPLYT